MRITYDQGTLLFDGTPERIARLPGVRWDARVGRFRAPGLAYRDLKRALGGAPLDDAVLTDSPAPPFHATVPGLRPYQEGALAAWAANDHRGLVVLPTGAGKSRIGAAAIASLRCRSLVLVPTRVLMEQWLRGLAELGIGPLGQWGDGVHELAPVTVATYEGALRSAPHLGARFELVVVDEVHHFGTGFRDELLELLVAPTRLGLTATMSTETAALAKLTTLVGPIVFELAMSDLTGRWLASMEHLVMNVQLTPDERRAYDEQKRVFHDVFDALFRQRPGAPWPELVALANASDRGQRALAALRASQRIVNLCEAKRATVTQLLDRHRDTRVLVFTQDNEVAYDVARRNLVTPITCDIKKKERERAITQFREGTIRAIVSARVLNEGFDVPDAEVAIVAGGALGEREHVQRIGRVLRPRPGKIATVYEIVVTGTSDGRKARRRQAAFTTNGRRHAARH